MAAISAKIDQDRLDSRSAVAGPRAKRFGHGGGGQILRLQPIASQSGRGGSWILGDDAVQRRDGAALACRLLQQVSGLVQLLGQLQRVAQFRVRPNGAGGGDDVVFERRQGVVDPLGLCQDQCPFQSRIVLAEFLVGLRQRRAALLDQFLSKAVRLHGGLSIAAQLAQRAELAEFAELAKLANRTRGVAGGQQFLRLVQRTLNDLQRLFADYYIREVQASDADVPVDAAALVW
jgi:hypothetical protein